jgi:glycosyltransferase involved in cell wall biosynthesis
MSKQLIIYDKDSGVISRVMLFSYEAEKLTPEQLGLDKNFDLSKTGILIESDKRFINIKKDRIINGILTQPQARKELEKKELSKTTSVSVFDDVSYAYLPEHVALITTWNKQCGISNYSRDLVDNLQCRVTIFCEKDNNPDYHNPKVKVIPCWTNRDTSYDYLVDLLKKNKVDVAHVQYNHDLLNAGQLKIFGNELKAAGIRSIMTLHSSKGGVDIYGKHFDQFIVHSQASAKDIIGENASEEQINIIPIGSGKPPIDKTKKVACIEKHLDYNRPIISNFGFFLPQKGIKEQISALAILRNKYPNILLLAVCALHTVQNKKVSEEYYNECKNLVDELGLNNNVLFLTDYLPIEESITYLQCSDVVVLPYINSAAQATSSAGRTAIMASRPTILTDVEIFSDFEDVVLKIEPRNIELLADSINKHLCDNVLRENSLQKIQRFIDKTSWENVAKEHMRIYKSFGDIKIDIEGQVFSYFSASVVNRNLACSLYELGADVTLKSVGLAENPNYTMGDSTSEIVQRKPNNLICVRHQFPPNFVDFQARTKIMYLPVETSVPDDWVEAIEKNDIDFVWVYTNHGKDLMRKAGVTKPVEVIRCGVDENLFNTSVIPIDLENIKDSHTKKTQKIDDDTFIFMFVGHAQERKNFKAMFKAYLTEFNVSDNVVFVIKSYDGGEVHKTIQELIDYVSGVLERPKEVLPKHLYIYEDTDPNILPSYFAAADVMVQCSRAEGFGKPIVEAMALGIPSIAVHWSGPKDFCTEKNSFPVPFSLAKSSYHVQSKAMESVWADTKIEDLRSVMRYCFENRDEVKKRGQEALKDSEKWLMKEVVFDVIKFVRKYNL